MRRQLARDGDELVGGKHFRISPNPAPTQSSCWLSSVHPLSTILIPLLLAMGGSCSKESKNNNFVGPGRVLGSAPPRDANPRAPLPSKTVQGGAGGIEAQQGPGKSLGSRRDPNSPGAAAASAADVR